jgi:hypothetical protein
MAIQATGSRSIVEGNRGVHRINPIWAVLVVLAVPASAQDRVNPLESASGLRCRFVLGVEASWKGEQPAAAVKPQETNVVVSDIDIQGGTADVRGPDGRGFATAMLSGGSLYILHIDRGSLNVTSVFATETSPKRFKATQTRQNFVYLTVPPFIETPTVTQSYGDCAVLSADVN